MHFFIHWKCNITKAVFNVKDYDSIETYAIGSFRLKIHKIVINGIVASSFLGKLWQLFQIFQSPYGDFDKNVSRQEHMCGQDTLQCSETIFRSSLTMQTASLFHK